MSGPNSRLSNCRSFRILFSKLTAFAFALSVLFVFECQTSAHAFAQSTSQSTPQSTEQTTAPIQTQSSLPSSSKALAPLRSQAAIQLNQGSNQTSPKPIPAAATVQDDLPWQPGLGRPVDQRLVDPRLSNPVALQPEYQRPQQAVPMQNARPMPYVDPASQVGPSMIVQQPNGQLNSPPPQSVLTDLRTLNSNSSSLANNQPSPNQANSYAVTPAAFVANESPGNATPANTANKSASETAGAIQQETTQSAAAASSNNAAENQQSSTQQTEGMPTGNREVVDARITTVTRGGMQQLPNDAGQVWRTYDISPYTYSIQTSQRPEQAIIDWILKETGTEMWFTQPMGILNASRDKLHVYHTPAVQNQIKPIVDRFVYSRGKVQVVGLKLVTIASPNWRSTAFPMMTPITVSSPGVEAWLMSKESAAILSSTLRNRSDYQEHNNGDLIINDGQKYTLANTRPVQFLRSLARSNDALGQYQPIQDRIDEGYSVDFSALSSLDGRSIEAIIGCNINQIEKMQRVTVDLQNQGQTQPVDLQIPQMVSWNVNERFRWPSDQVLVVSCGVVATPGPQREALLGIPALFNGTRGRADALMFIEYKGVAQSAPATTPQTANSGTANSGQSGMIPIAPRR